MITAGVPWDQLEHALGRASDLPVLLDAVSRARGDQLRKCMGDVCDRVLHQGTIYNSSPAAVHELIAMSDQRDTRDKALFYNVLGEFASSARQAIRDGHATPCCSGGDPQDGAAILTEILQAHDRFAADLEHSDPAIRAFAGALLTPSEEADAAAIRLVRARYQVEKDAGARLSLLKDLIRVRGKIADWRDFLKGALGREPDPGNRCLLRCAEVREWKEETPAASVEELIPAAVQMNASGLFDVLHELGERREFDGLLRCLQIGTDRNLLRGVAGRLLRITFHDQRTGWENLSHSIMQEGGEPEPNGSIDGLFKVAIQMVLLLMLGKVFPFLLRRKLRKAAEANAKRRRQVEYWGLEGEAPEIPTKLTADQQSALAAMADKAELWFDTTNLWTLFGLPDNAEELRRFVATRA